MKRTFYLSITSSKYFTILFLAIVLLCGVTAKAQPYTAFTQGTEPGFTSGNAAANLNDPGPDAIETGVKFRVTQGGLINGVWFFRGNTSTGPYVGQLWKYRDSSLLATVSSAVGGFGWQYLNFASSVSILPDTIYIVSVYSPGGIYASSAGFFSGPFGPFNGIELLCDCNISSPGNGVYDYTTTGALTSAPNNSFGASNYWIDVSYSPFFPLAVNLSDLKATTNNTDVSVSWKTSSETNNRGFEVQRSNNGIDWYPLSFVSGAGESNATKNYSYTDKSLAPGKYYYRLKQEDFDGKSKNSPIVTATISGKGNIALFQNSPNPFSAITTIRFDLPRGQKIRLSVFDMAGREIKVLTDKTNEAGSHLVTLDAATLSRQLYLVRLQTEDGVLTKTILVQ